ncbi:putative Acid phosphatase [Lupinus albus]|uniref:Purple acid phosphatase n=1 Tax=Lupinus albus TaxID=3870 RepID=A0A6A4Q074_LUPAL|nr:putative Acid phosphatase [Lupinus albus]
MVYNLSNPCNSSIWSNPSADSFNAIGVIDSYRYLFYYSGPVHNVIVGPLHPNTIYYYRMGDSTKVYTFKTPPSQFPIKFAFVKWESFGGLIEPLTSQRPWMVTTGDHDVEKIFILHRRSFTAYNTRYLMLFNECGSNSNQYYSFEVAGIHVIMLGSYTDFDSKSNQYKWLQGDLEKLNRVKTPWVVVMFHTPWYNSNTRHRGEYESIEMKASMEDLLYQARVDLVISAHIHAYERFVSILI